MKEYKDGVYTGERALYNTHGADIDGCVFEDGESPLKESSRLDIKNTEFRWKYPLWYCKDVSAENTTLRITARSGIWYTHGISFKDSLIEAPKTFRRASKISLLRTDMPNADETLWDCRDVRIEKVKAKGDYFGMNAEGVFVDGLELDGNYAFDGGKNIEVNSSRLISKDAFWNTENVTVTDSYIEGEYLGWNSKNLTFINCTIESNQGLCYIENLKMVNCTLIKTDLAFELSTVECGINSSIDSVKNPISGKIHAKRIDELILDREMIDPEKTEITTEEQGRVEYQPQI